MFTPVQLLDPVRMVYGARNDRYDRPDVAALDRHIGDLRRRITSIGEETPNFADDYRADIDRLLDHRLWLTLPVASSGRVSSQPTDPLPTAVSPTPPGALAHLSLLFRDAPH